MPVNRALTVLARLWDVARGAQSDPARPLVALYPEAARIKGHAGSVNALCVLPDGRLASGAHDHTIRLWDVALQREISRLEVDAPINCLIALNDCRFIAGDELGLLHWLQVIDSALTHDTGRYHA